MKMKERRYERKTDPPTPFPRMLWGADSLGELKTILGLLLL